jgi:hypothetical protein
MTVKTLFSIILKVLGIFFIKDILNSIIQTFAFIVMLGHSSRSEELDFKELLIMAGITLIYGMVSYFLIFKSDILIEKLHIEKGFDQEVIPLNMHRSTILSISIIVIGGYMVVDEIPTLCRQLFAYYQHKNLYLSSSYGISYTVLAAAKIVIGLLLIGLQRPLVNLIELKRTPEVTVNDEVETDTE